MVRTPPGYNRRAGGWPPGLVVPAGSMVNRQVLPAHVPPHHYLTPAQVPIGPYGFAQGIVQGYKGVTGQLTAPAAFATLTSVGPIPAGVYTINWTVQLSGSAGAGDANNFQLYNNGVLLANSVNAGAAGIYPQAPVTATVPPGGGQFLEVTAGAGAGSPGAVYKGTITGASLPLTLHVGPSAFGTAWQLAQASIGTTTGANDTSTAEFFAQPYGTPAAPFQVGQSYAAGGDQVGLSGIKLVTGEFLFVVWTGANPGDTATLVLSGTQVVLT